MSILPDLGKALAKEGATALTNILTDATSAGVDKAQAYLEEKTGIPLSTLSNASELSKDDLSVIRECAESNALEMYRLVLEEMKLAHADAADARARMQTRDDQLDEIQSIWIRDFAKFIVGTFSYFFAAGLAIYFCHYIEQSSFDPNAGNNQSIIMLNLGTIYALFGSIIGFFFGASVERAKQLYRSRPGSTSDQSQPTR